MESKLLATQWDSGWFCDSCGCFVWWEEPGYKTVRYGYKLCEKCKNVDELELKDRLPRVSY